VVWVKDTVCIANESSQTQKYLIPAASTSVSTDLLDVQQMKQATPRKNITVLLSRITVSLGISFVYLFYKFFEHWTNFMLLSGHISFLPERQLDKRRIIQENCFRN